MNKKNKTPCVLCQKLLWLTLTVLVAPGLNAATSGMPEKLAQGAGAPTGPPVVSPGSPTAPPEIIKPALPSELENADSVFKKLDVDKRGYVTLDETKDLIGFEDAFKAVDDKDSGKLTPAQFRKAWSIYKTKK